MCLLLVDGIETQPRKMNFLLAPARSLNCALKFRLLFLAGKPPVAGRAVAQVVYVHDIICE